MKKEYWTVPLITIYILVAIGSFGHSFQQAKKTKEIIPVLNCVFLGAPWPLYMSYIYFYEEALK